MKKFCGRWEFGNCSRKLDCWKIFDKYFGKPCAAPLCCFAEEGCPSVFMYGVYFGKKKLGTQL